MKKAFTLAEVLLVVAIIGVIAAMTIPTLINNIQNKELVEGLKSNYSILTQAVNNLNNDYGSIESAAGLSVSVALSFYNALKTELKIVKACDANKDAGVCFHNGMTGYKNLHGDNGPYDFNIVPRVILANGAMIGFSTAGATDCSSTPTIVTSGPLYQSSCEMIAIDINGFKKPNVLGRDIFMFWIAKTGLYPRGSHGDYDYETSNFCNPTLIHAWSGQACAAKVLTEQAISY